MLPCNHQIWTSWAPLAERTTLVTIAIAGMNVGTVVTMPLTGLLTKYGFDGGWASVFYCFGTRIVTVLFLSYFFECCEQKASQFSVFIETTVLEK